MARQVITGSQASVPVKKKRRARPGVKALMEIRKYQRSTKRLIPRAPVVRLVKEVVQDVSRRKDLRIKPEAISALQEVILRCFSINF